MTNLRVFGLLMLVALLGLAWAGCGGTRLDGHGVLFVRKDPGSPSTGIGPVYVWQPGSKSTSKVSQSKDPKSWVQWSPDGKQISFVAIKGYLGDSPTIGNTGDLWVASAKDVATAKEFTTKRCCPVPVSPDTTCDCSGAGGVFAPSWSPDSRQIVYVHEGSNFANRLRLLTLKTGSWRPLHISGSYPAWGPRGIAYFFGASIRLLNPLTGRWKPFASIPESQAICGEEVRSPGRGQASWRPWKDDPAASSCSTRPRDDRSDDSKSRSQPAASPGRPTASIS